MKYYIFSILRVLQFLTLPFNHLRKPRVRVLILHDISEQELPSFSNLIGALRKEWDVLSGADFLRYMADELPIKRNSLLITFDDGFQGSFEAYERVLKPAGIKPIFFLSTDFVGCEDEQKVREFVTNNLEIPNEQYEFDRHRPMSWEEVKALKDDGCLIGSHTASHLRLSTSSEAQLSENLIRSIDSIGRKVGDDKVTEFAFPFGNKGSIDEDSLEVSARYFERIYTGFRGDNIPGETYIYRDAINLKEPVFYSKIYLAGLVDLIYR